METTVETLGKSKPRNRALLAAIGLVVLATVALVLTLYTGLPGPGILRRYPADDLNHLVAQINANQIAVPGDGPGAIAPSRPAAYIDWIRSRVVVRQKACTSLFLTPADRAMIENPDSLSPCPAYDGP